MTVTRNMSVNFEKGIFQMNDFLINNGQINLISGDVILQATQSFGLSWFNQKQTFCVAAPTISNRSISMCSISGDSNS